MRSHLFSYRTQKLSSLAPKILCWRRHGKIGSCCIQKRKHPSKDGCFSFCSNLPNLPYGKMSQFVATLYYFYGTYSFKQCKPFLLKRRTVAIAPLNGSCCNFAGRIVYVKIKRLIVLISLFCLYVCTVIVFVYSIALFSAGGSSGGTVPFGIFPSTMSFNFMFFFFLSNIMRAMPTTMQIKSRTR